jgi:hypothetical protein
VGAVCTKEAVTVGGNALLTSGKKTESIDAFEIFYSLALCYTAYDFFINNFYSGDLRSWI